MLIEVIKENLLTNIEKYKQVKDKLTEIGLKSDRDLTTSHSHLVGSNILPSRYIFGNIVSDVDFNVINMVYNMQNLEKDKINKLSIKEHLSLQIYKRKLKNFFEQFKEVEIDNKKIEKIIKETRNYLIGSGIKKNIVEEVTNYLEQLITTKEKENLSNYLYKRRKELCKEYTKKEKLFFNLESDDELQKVIKNLTEVERYLNKKGKSILDFKYSEEIIEDFKERIRKPFKIFDENLNQINYEIVEDKGKKIIEIYSSKVERKNLEELLNSDKYFIKPEVPLIVLSTLGSVHLGAKYFKKYAIDKKLLYNLAINLGFDEKDAEFIQKYGSETTYGIEIWEPYLLNNLLVNQILKKEGKDVQEFINDFFKGKYKDRTKLLKIYSKKDDKFYDFLIPEPLNTKELTEIIRKIQ